MPFALTEENMNNGTAAAYEHLKAFSRWRKLRVAAEGSACVLENTWER